jgi:hypothetical protein
MHELACVAGRRGTMVAVAGMLLCYAYTDEQGTEAPEGDGEQKRAHDCYPRIVWKKRLA